MPLSPSHHHPDVGASCIHAKYQRDQSIVRPGCTALSIQVVEGDLWLPAWAAARKIRARQLEKVDQFIR